MQFDLENAIEILSQTPATLRSMLGNLSKEWVHGGTPDNWDPYIIVGHLIHAEMTDWIPRARLILAQGENRTFAPFDRLAQLEHSKGKTLADLLNEFEEHRAGCIAELKAMNIGTEELALTANHPALGEVTLEMLLSTWVVHDLNHIRQIVVFLAGKYGENVGPWQEYLKILH